jgi:uncharacterized membrane protein
LSQRSFTTAAAAELLAERLARAEFEEDEYRHPRDCAGTGSHNDWLIR